MNPVAPGTAAAPNEDTTINRNAVHIGCLLIVTLLSCPVRSYARQNADAATVRAADGGRFVLSAAIQARASYARSDAGGTGVGDTGNGISERMGFGLRRARFRVTARLASKAGIYMQVDGANGGVTALDFFARYRASDRVELRFGRMAGAQPRGFILTPLFQIDVADRAAIAERWGALTVGGDGRDFGVDVRYRNAGTDAMLYIHNGDGSWNRMRGNFRPSISASSVTSGVNSSGMAATAAVSRQVGPPGGIEIGGFAGVNTRRGPLSERAGTGRSYATYGTHAYLGAIPGSRLIRIKLDVVVVSFERESGRADGQLAAGASLLVAARPRHFLELFVRAERFDPDRNDSFVADAYWTAGATISPAALHDAPFNRERLTIAWQRFAPGGSPGTESLLFLQVQFGF